MKQQQAAQEALINWLSDEHELGAAPSRIECTGSFTLHGLCYYIFKYKKTPLGKWLLGVSGGYEEDSNEHCGHVFSEMRPYDAATATKQASEMVEMIRKYWMQRAEEILSEQGDGSQSTDDSIPTAGGLLSPIQRKRIRELDNACEFFAILELLDEGIHNGNYRSDDLDGDLEAALWKAYACVNLDMYGMAERCLRRVRHEGEGNYLWCYRYSIALMHLCRYEESLRYARIGTAIEPEYPWGWLQQARISYQAGEIEEALESVRRGLELVPNDYEFLTTQREIEEKQPFSVMLGHFIDPVADQERQEKTLSAPPAQPNEDWFEEPGPNWDVTSNDGRFVGFVLLSSPEWSPERFREQLLADWGIPCPAEAGEAMSFPVGKDIVAVSLIPAPVPNGEAEENAVSNYLWPGAVNAAKAHQAQLVVAVLGRNEPKTETGKLFVKVCASCLKQKSVLGLYASGTVFQPNFYLDAAAVMPEGELPVLDWIHFGLCRTEKGISGYTFGMTAFDKEEIEVIDSGKSPQELRDFLLDVACYILSEDIALKEGETIGFSSSQKLPVTRSEGIYVEGNTLKIAY